MGTCMSKDKKGAETPVAPSVLISSSSSPSLTQKSQETEQVSIAINNNTNTITAILTSPYSYEQSLPIPIARPYSSPSPYLSSPSSSGEEIKETNTTDKHVVEIRLPMASPSKFKSSPSSANLAAKAMASIARQEGGGEAEAEAEAEEEEEEEEDGDRYKDRISEDRDKDKGREGGRDRDRVREEGIGRDREYRDDDDDDDYEEEDDGRDSDSDETSDDGESSDADEEAMGTNPYISLPPPPLFYISRASFSRDLAAFSRDLAALSSPLGRSPSVNGAHDLISAALRASSHTPLRHYNPSKMHTLEERSTRSRSLPKRFYNKCAESSYKNLSVISHKRSSSRDGDEKSSYPKRMAPSSLCSASIVEHPSLSPRLSVRREEASGEDRVHARQAAARKGRRQHHNDDHDQYRARQAVARKGQHRQNNDCGDDDHVLKAYPSSNLNPNHSFRRSPLRHSSSGKVAADVDQFGYFQENQNATQIMHASGSPKNNQMKGRAALRERSVNCTPNSVDTGLKVPLKHHKQKVITKAKLNEGVENKDMSIIENEVYEECLSNHQSKMQIEDPSIYYTTKPKEICKERSKENSFYKEISKERFKENSKENSKLRSKESLKEKPKENCSDALAMYPGTMHDRIRSIIEALSEMNTESSFLSEMDESEVEMESDIDLFNVRGPTSPRKDMKAQQARNILLKEAAMDAFARPSFYSNICSQEELGLESESGKKPTGLAALMAMKLTDTEADTLKIRKVLNLLSIAESEMGKDQKMVFYSQLRMVLDSLKLAPIMEQNKIQEREDEVEGLNGKCITSRANSWPRTVKDPLHLVSSLMVSTSPHMPMQTDLVESGSSSNLDDKRYARNVVELDKDMSQNGASFDVMDVIGLIPDNDEGCIPSPVEWTKEYLETESNYLPTSNPYSHDISYQHHDNNNQARVNESEADDLSPENVTACAISALINNQQSSQDIIKLSDEDRKNVGVEMMDSSNVDNSNMSIKTATTTTTNKQEIENDEKQCVDGVPSPQNQCVLQALEHTEEMCTERKMMMIPNNVMTSSLLIKCDDGASDASSFEFRARSNASTPRSTPSTPMISTATTPRRVSQLNHRLSCDDIWEAFE